MPNFFKNSPMMWLGMIGIFIFLGGVVAFGHYMIFESNYWEGKFRPNDSSALLQAFNLDPSYEEMFYFCLILFIAILIPIIRSVDWNEPNYPHGKLGDNV